MARLTALFPDDEASVPVPGPVPNDSTEDLESAPQRMRRVHELADRLKEARDRCEKATDRAELARLAAERDEIEHELSDANLALDAAFGSMWKALVPTLTRVHWHARRRGTDLKFASADAEEFANDVVGETIAKVVEHIEKNLPVPAGGEPRRAWAFTIGKNTTEDMARRQQTVLRHGVILAAGEDESDPITALPDLAAHVSPADEASLAALELTGAAMTRLVDEIRPPYPTTVSPGEARERAEEWELLLTLARKKLTDDELDAISPGPVESSGDDFDARPLGDDVPNWASPDAAGSSPVDSRDEARATREQSFDPVLEGIPTAATTQKELAERLGLSEKDVSVKVKGRLRQRLQRILAEIAADR